MQTHFGNRHRAILSLTAVAAAALVVASSPSASAQTLDAYWTGAGTYADASGNGNTLTNAGTTFGFGGQAFDLNGSSYLYDPSPSFELAATDFTISVWANFASLDENGAGGLPNTFVGDDDGGGNIPKSVFYLDASDSSLGFLGYNSGPAVFAEAPLISTPSLGSWNMYTVTGNALAGTASFYEDGQFLGTVGGVQFPSPGAALTIGEAEGLGFINGGLADIQVYNGALSPTQISTLYTTQNSLPSAAPEPGDEALVACVVLPMVGAAIGRRRRA
jgi:hypothetical protein